MKTTKQTASRTAQILSHLRREKHGISPLEALGVYGVYRLSSVIHRLRERGHEIQTVMRNDALGKPYARYKLLRSAV